MNAYKATCRHESGVALLVALVFLLMLSLIGVSAMQGTTMQEKMSGNLRDQHSAFNAAEAALREGERQAKNSYRSGSLDEDNPDNSGEYTASFTPSEVPVWRIDLLSNMYVGAGYEASTDPVGAVIRVTASSAGFTGRSDVELESIYVVED